MITTLVYYYEMTIASQKTYMRKVLIDWKFKNFLDILIPYLRASLYSTKIKEQTRKLATDSSKYRFKVVDKTKQVSSKHCFELADEKAGQKGFKMIKPHPIRYI